MLKIKPLTFIIVAALLLGALACQQQDQARTQAQAQMPSEYENLGITLSGSAASPVRIAVFSDFQCEGCRELFINAIKPLMDEYKDKVNVTYYEYPLNRHSYSRPAARYVSAAAKLGPRKALPVIEALFADQTQWVQTGNLEFSVMRALSREDFLKVQKILSDEEFLKEINGNIEKEQRLGMQKQVEATPTMFIYHGNEKEQKVEGSVTYPVLNQFVAARVK